MPSAVPPASVDAAMYAPALAAHDSTVRTSLAGRWQLTLTEPDGTELVVRMSIESRDDRRWEAYSRPGVANEIVGSATALLGRMAGKLPPRGALVWIESGSAERRGDTITIDGTLKSPFLTDYRVHGRVLGDRFTATMVRPNASATSMARTGSLIGARVTDDTPVRDYATLAEHVVRTARTNVFDPKFFDANGPRDALEELRARMTRSHDDLDAVAAFQGTVSKLGSSHWSFIRNPELARTPLDVIIAGDSTVNPDTLVSFNVPVPGVAHLYVRKWDRVAPAIDRAFKRIDSLGITTLILDIRSNPGGDATSIAPAAHLFDAPQDVGVFLGNKWYATHAGPPTIAERGALPMLSSDSSGARLIEQIRASGAVFGRVVPRAPYFAGTVYLLVDEASASASEPLAHLLKTTKRATLIGERTSGRMLTAIPHDVGDGWVLRVPEADYFAADGTRLEGRGVVPDVSTRSPEALIEAASRIKVTSAYYDAVLRAWSNTAARRTDEGEKWNLRARALAPDSIAPVYGLSTTYRVRGDWDRVFGVWEERLAAHPGDPTALFQIGATAAIFGRNLDRGVSALREYLALPRIPAASRAYARKRLASIFVQQGDTRAARAAYDEVLRDDPNDLEAIRARRVLPP